MSSNLDKIIAEARQEIKQREIALENSAKELKKKALQIIKDLVKGQTIVLKNPIHWGGDKVVVIVIKEVTETEVHIFHRLVQLTSVQLEVMNIEMIISIIREIENTLEDMK